jgi:hypothetical protein
VDGTHLVEPHQVAAAFANHFKLVYDNTAFKVPSNTKTSFDDISTDNLSVFSVTDADVRKVIKRLKPSKSAALDGIPRFIIKGCTDIFVPLLKNIFNHSLSQQLFPSFWKKAAIVPIFKKGNSNKTANYRPISILNKFSNIF